MVAAADADRSTDVEMGGAPSGDTVTGGMATGNLGLCSWAKLGYQPKIGNIEPQPTMRYCWTIWKMVLTIQ
jgi:hypothetical protein